MGTPADVRLAARFPDLDLRMRRRYADLFLSEARLSRTRFEDAVQSVEVTFADASGSTLRVTSRYTGSSRVLYDWKGDLHQLEDFIDMAARDDGYLVREERESEGSTDWD